MESEYYKCGCGKWDEDSIICEKHQIMFRVADKISRLGEKLFAELKEDMK